MRYSETVINLNSTNMVKDNKRYMQLAVVYWYMRRQMNSNAFAELEGADSSDRIYLPFRLQLAEVMGLMYLHGLKMLYIEENAQVYVEIQFDSIVVSGPPELVEMCQNTIAQAEREVVQPALYFKHSGPNDVEWVGLAKKTSVVVRTLGDQIFGSGYVMLHLLNADPSELKDLSLLDTYWTETEYIEIISNIEEGKFILISPLTRDIVAGGLCLEERARMVDILKGDLFDIDEYRKM